MTKTELHRILLSMEATLPAGTRFRAEARGNTVLLRAVCTVDRQAQNVAEQEIYSTNIGSGPEKAARSRAKAVVLNRYIHSLGRA